MPRIIVGVSGASGTLLTQSVLQHLSTVPNMEIHLIVSNGAKCVLAEEQNMPLSALTRYARTVYDENNMAAAPSSGSWQHDGMMICPCSMSSLASIATGVGTTLIHRAADVCLKERRPLIIVARETPLNLIHLRNMQSITEAGASVMPFCPAFYTGKTDFDSLTKHFTGRMLDLLHVPHTLCYRWTESVEANGNA